MAAAMRLLRASPPPPCRRIASKGHRPGLKRLSVAGRQQNEGHLAHPPLIFLANRKILGSLLFYAEKMRAGGANVTSLKSRCGFSAFQALFFAVFISASAHA